VLDAEVEIGRVTKQGHAAGGLLVDEPEPPPTTESVDDRLRCHGKLPY
jgi:hypothetical protein